MKKPINGKLLKALTKLARAMKKNLPNFANRQPFNGKFYVEGEEEPLKIPRTATIDELMQQMSKLTMRQKKQAALKEWIEKFTGGDNALAADLLERESRRQKNKSKLKSFYPLKIKKNNIYIKLSDQNEKKVTFRRYAVAKTLYIFFLRQIIRAENDPTMPSCLSQVEMENYTDELLTIYHNVCGKSEYGRNDIQSWFQKSTVSNDFINALSSIRNSFGAFFDTNTIKSQHGKCYSIEDMGTDPKGNPRYGINLKSGDFELDSPYNIIK